MDPVDPEADFDDLETTVKVQNAAPVLVGPGDQTATENVTKSFNLGSFSDLGAEDPTCMVRQVLPPGRV